MMKTPTDNKRPVVQEDQYGCGVASTAFILGKTYHETRCLFDVAKIENYETYCPDIAKVLNNAGYNYKWGQYDGQEIPDGSVVFISSPEYYKHGHWVVRWGKKWMDPWFSGADISQAEAKFTDTLRGNIEWYVYPSSERYHALIVDKSLNDVQEVLGMKVASQQRDGNWLIYKIEINHKDLLNNIKKIQNNLKADSPWYFHIYNEDGSELIIVFKDRVFIANPRSESWKEAIEYGLSVGIPKDQLDFFPKKFNEEIF